MIHGHKHSKEFRYVSLLDISSWISWHLLNYSKLDKLGLIFFETPLHERLENRASIPSSVYGITGLQNLFRVRLYFIEI